MDGEKPWYASRTIWGGIFAALGGAVPVLGNVLSIPGVQDAAVEAAGGLISVVGGAIAAWGRVQADSTITIKRAGQ